MAAGALAQGVVVDEGGQPVAGAEIFYFGRGPSEPGAALTDARGRFLFPNYERLEVPSIIARKDGHFSEWLNSEKTLEEYGPIRLTLRPGANLRVRVVDEEGAPIGWPIESISMSTIRATIPDLTNEPRNRNPASSRSQASRSHLRTGVYGEHTGTTSPRSPVPSH